MEMRRIGARWFSWRTLVMVAVLALAAGTASADTLTDSTTLPRALQYIGCAVGIATVASGAGLALVLGSCLLLIAEP